MKEKKRLQRYYNQKLNQALSQMFIAGQGSPGYKEAYKQYRVYAQILATPALNDRAQTVLIRK